MAEIMQGWNRPRGTVWTRRRGALQCNVVLGRGGWYGYITDQSGNIIARSEKPARRSRKARKQGDKLLLQLSSVRRMSMEELAQIATPVPAR